MAAWSSAPAVTATATGPRLPSAAAPAVTATGPPSPVAVTPAIWPLPPAAAVARAGSASTIRLAAISS
ncbi:MAG TPA: hypothetical protein VMC03_16815 [Streptosporangiaceae bacterium]|nr:hypothetical protein [Streptosporangiaceae bacterium]